jgi:diguanylate cyclase (GGDEF)-like protein
LTIQSSSIDLKAIMTVQNQSNDHPGRFLVVMDWVFSQFQQDIKLGIDRYAQREGIELVFLGVGSLDPSSPEDMAKECFFDFVSDSQFDGAIIVSNVLVNKGGERTLKEKLESLGALPKVSIGPSVIGEESIVIDNTAGMRSIMEHLIGHHGYRKFAYVSGPEASEEARTRLGIFRSSLDSAGIPHGGECEFFGNFLLPSGEAAVEELLERRGQEPEVIVCANDLMALGVWSALSSRGLACPRDVAITGFDDSRLMNVLSHQFTTVRQPFDDLGYIAASRLHDVVRGLPPSGERVLRPRLLVRGSCGCVEAQPPSSDAPSEQQIASFESLLDRGRRIASGKDLLKGTRDLCREWSGEIQKHLAGGKPVYELEEMLRFAWSAFRGPQVDEAAEALINALRSTLLEECGRALFAEHWREINFSMLLRIAMDELQVALSLDADLAARAPLFEAVAKRCKAKAFYVMRFIDRSDPLAGSSVAYSYDESGESWAPEPGSLFPRGRGSLAANMLTVDNLRFGYILVSSDGVPPQAVEYVRIRLSGIFRDQEILDDVRRLNGDLTNEIVARRESERRLKEALDMVEQLSVKDELTGLHNRRGFLNLAEQQVKLLRRNKSGFFVLFADLDGLKPINDRWGHGDGDIAIRTAGKVLRDSLRDSDLVARLGGDEFTALVSQAEPPSMDSISRRISEGCARESASLGKPWRVSLSMGYFYAAPDCDLDVERMLELADAELYKEKQRKRPGAPNPP